MPAESRCSHPYNGKMVLLLSPQILQEALPSAVPVEAQFAHQTASMLNLLC